MSGKKHWQSQCHTKQRQDHCVALALPVFPVAATHNGTGEARHTSLQLFEIHVLLSSRFSHALTMVHSLSTVRLETPNSVAISSIFMPPKKRSCTI